MGKLSLLSFKRSIEESDMGFGSATRSLHAWSMTHQAVRLLVCLVCVASTVFGQNTNQPQWIWSPDHIQGNVPQGSCYFRKTIYLPLAGSGQVSIAADDVYELFVNGKAAGEGNSTDELQVHDIAKLLRQGKNVVSVRVDNRNGQTAGLAAEIKVISTDGSERKYLSNPTWRTSLRVLPLWNTVSYRDGRWNAAKNNGVFGAVATDKQNPSGSTEGSLQSNPPMATDQSPPGKVNELATTPDPAVDASEFDIGSSEMEIIEPPSAELNASPTDDSDEDVSVATISPDDGSPSTSENEPDKTVKAPKEIAKESRGLDRPEFRVRPGFQVQHIAGNNDVGSLIAMAFNEFGQIIASQEGGPLLMLYDSNKDGTPDKVRICCTQVFSCQGILPVSGQLYVVGDGPVGNAVYELRDENHDGDFERATALVRFEGQPGEHGPHGLTLGPDGMLYVSIGNHTKLTQPFALSSPHQNYYEGELVRSRFEDPRGHAQGIKAPGGGVVRIDLEGRRVELFAGGLRNAYDLAFNKDGDLFTHDSDMESDIGTPWHRPTRLINLISGGEYGWRSGWAKWPDYLADTLPAVVETDRGSPTGSIFYDHWAYPAKYRNAMFSCDWAQGQIRAFRFDRRGAGYAATNELFLEGNPLNVTDLDVGPDGWLYFCTGGRGTSGNIYRVVWNEKIPAEQRDLGQGIVRAVRQPQTQSAWGRQAVSLLRRDLDDIWDQEIRRFVSDVNNSPSERAHALQLMHLLGPPPADIELRELSLDAEPLVRAKAAYLMGLIGNQTTSTRLAEMLRDHTAFVRRQAAEALARKEVQVDEASTFGMLSSPDRYEAWAARRLLERNRGTLWHESILRTKNPRVFIQGSMAILISQPDRAVALRIVKRFAQISRGFVSDADFTDMLRVVHLAIERGGLKPQELTDLSAYLAEEFPAGNIRINRELTRLLVFLKPPSAIDRMLSYLQKEVPDEEKLHVAMHLAFFDQGMTANQRVRLLAYLEQADERKGGQNLAGYVREARNMVVKSMPREHLLAALQDGNRLPKTALSVLFAVPEEKDAYYLDALEDLDRRISGLNTPAHNQLKIGLLAVLSRGKDPQAMGYLREVYDRDPERRQAVAMGLAQSPEGRNWDYLVRSIPLLDGEPAREVLLKLRQVAYAPQDPEHVRQLILCGLRLGENGAKDAIELLQHWVGTTPEKLGQNWESQLAAWQSWFESTYPSRPVATLPVESGDNRWTYDDLLTYLSSDDAASASVEQGAEIYVKAKCADCHIHGELGENAGPDLTTLSRRFQVREVLESIIYPSQVISDQYASHTVFTTDGKQLKGLVIPREGGGIRIVPSEGKSVVLDEIQIDEILPNNTSAMPEGLLNELNLSEIADLFAFLMHVPNGAVASPQATKIRR